MKQCIFTSFGLAVLAGFSLVTPALAVSIADVPIGNANNWADPATGSLYGAVSYAYQIAKNETTISQYAEFLTAVAKTDTYGLYNTSMTTSYINGISRSGVSGAYSYTVTAGSGNKPITYVSWFDAARFCNWLHNGQPRGLQTSGTTEDGAYSLLGAVSGTGFSVQPDAKAWIPSESEWYKAAYYDPNKGGAGVGGYWSYPTQSNTMTTNDIGVAGAANCYDANGYAVYTGSGAGTWVITDVGAYGVNSDSAYGTNDQGGNVWEWNDAIISGSSRGLRGGSWGSLDYTLQSSYRYGRNPSNEYDGFGFRVASVPEPTSVVLAMVTSGMLLIRRKR
ncbi:MAG: SUMF1/EgtB/PvdO family nonheme iron enzyme [Verrucomicrobia bacterium]|nr:SUMF1/EgtB/PvdO family nonheme iron enzyme [Verrucomicrobiota bacterium]